MKLKEILKYTEVSFDDKFGEFEISAISSLAHATKTELSYCDSDKNTHLLSSSKAGAIIVKDSHKALVPKNSVAIISANPHLSFAKLSKAFAKPLFRDGKSVVDESTNVMPNAFIGNASKIGAGCVIMSGAYIGDNVTIGNDCIIYPNAVIYNDTIIGNGCIIHANAVIGSDGFGYAHTNTGEHIKIYHNGSVILEDFVEIGACSTIDRGVFDPTIIKKGTKIDNLVQIGHNCELGANCLIVSQTGLAGSTKLGRNVVMGGQSGSAGHVEVGDFAQIAARGGVSKNLQGAKNYAGHPIVELKDWLKLHAKIAKFFKNN
ncbi:MAG: UDP-3-O-(3-hydroxymyristoyl)glucosamine N-acyltransferase [Campylobacter sp.]|nr:UDP-3-O-(3-hydroxymyristoyl)glucosamine N-acyltransferase [Campylobacter sp.]